MALLALVSLVACSRLGVYTLTADGAISHDCVGELPVERLSSEDTAAPTESLVNADPDTPERWTIEVDGLAERWGCLDGEAGAFQCAAGDARTDYTEVGLDAVVTWSVDFSGTWEGARIFRATRTARVSCAGDGCEVLAAQGVAFCTVEEAVEGLWVRELPPAG